MNKSPFSSITKEDELLYGVQAAKPAKLGRPPKPAPPPIEFTVSSTPDSSMSADNEPSQFAAKDINVSKEETVRIDDTVKPTLGYAGDTIDDNNEPLKQGGFEKIEFLSPDELLSVYDANIREQTVVLHKWQREVSEELAGAKATQLNPHKFVLCACNGSGKD